jgi:hypothetical protein
MLGIYESKLKPPSLRKRMVGRSGIDFSPFTTKTFLNNLPMILSNGGVRV